MDSALGDGDSIGESKTNNGVKATLTGFFDNPQMKYKAGKAVKTVSAGENGTLLFSHINTEVVGPNARMPPIPAGVGLVGEDQIRLKHHDERMNVPSFIGPPEYYNIESRGFTPYRTSWENQVGHTNQNPGFSLSGWLVHKLPESYDIGELSLELHLGSTSSNNFDSERLEIWSYNEEGRFDDLVDAPDSQHMGGTAYESGGKVPM